MSTSSSNLQQQLLKPSIWKWYEVVLWALVFASPWLFPGHALIVNEVAIVALFALSLDLVLGYSGVVSLGHAAFLGFGAYTAALFARAHHAGPPCGLVAGHCCHHPVGRSFLFNHLARHRFNPPDGDIGAGTHPFGVGQQIRSG
jgi:ABC-type branched-subunit amino acid transport system permease subunit